MFLIEKKTSTEVQVFAVSTDKCGYPKFLIYKDGQWIWRSAKHFRPYMF